MTAPLKALKHVAQAGGLMGREPFRIMTAQMMGEAAQVVYRDGQGTIDSQILFRDKEAELVILSGGRKWSFEGVVVPLRAGQDANASQNNCRDPRTLSRCTFGSLASGLWPLIRGSQRAHAPQGQAPHMQQIAAAPVRWPGPHLLERHCMPPQAN